MQRYFIQMNQITNDSIEIRGNDFHHIKNVMRFRIGESALFVDVSGTNYLAQLTELSKDCAFFRIESHKVSEKLRTKITIAQALIKKDSFELFLEKATELGVYEIIPTLFHRSIIKIEEKEESKKLERYRAIVKEASEQSERDYMPFINELSSLKKLNYNEYDHVLVCYEREDVHSNLKSILPSIKKEDRVLVLIGPEGGITDEELEFLKSKNAKTVSLGSGILRSETASLMLLSCFIYEWEL